jgi:CheY-like chemotaxis protein
VATPGAALAEALADPRWSIVVVNLAGLAAREGQGIGESVLAAKPGAALVFCGIEQLSEDDEARLRGYTDSIIVKSPQAKQRLLENIERFLRSVPRPAPAGQRQAQAGTRRLVGQRILVIDDDPRNIFVVTAALEQEGAAVLSALNGRRALELLERESVNLIITDIMMPEMDGYQTIAAIRAHPLLRTVPVIALTAKAMPQDQRSILEIGADDYLSKPVSYDVLNSMAALWCGKTHAV